jgi:DNA topoisomerase IA
MADQIVITERSSQAKDVRSAVGSRYGEIFQAEGHLFDLLEPEDVVPAWKSWSPILLRPEGLYGTRPAEGGNKAAKLRAIREALRTAKRVWLATDCDREGQLIGQEILEHYEYRGQSCEFCSPRRIRRPSATHSIGQNQIPNMPPFTPQPLHAGRPTRSTTCHSPPAPRPSFLGRARGE